MNEKLKGAFSKDPFIAILKKFNKGYYPEPWDRILFKIQEYAAENHLTVGFNTAQARHLGILLEALSSYRFMDLQKDKPIRIHLSDFNEVMDQDLYTDENRRKSPESQNILHEYKEYFLENTKRECNVNPEVAIIESVGAKALANYMGMIEKVDVLNNVIKEGRQALQPIQATEEGAKLSGDLNELRTFHDSLLSINELDDFLNNGKVLQEKIAKAVKEAPRS